MCKSNLEGVMKFNINFNVHECNPVKYEVMSDSWQPHGLYLTRLLCPYNSPGKNIRMGLLCPYNSPGKNIRMGLPFPSPGDIPTQYQTQVSHIAGRFFTV